MPQKNKIQKIRNGGRPRMKAEDKKSVIITFRADRFTKIVLDEKVKEAKQTVSGFLRQAINNGKMTTAEIDNCCSEIDKFNSADLLELLIVSTTVVKPISPEEIQLLRSLYDFADNVRIVAKRANEQFSGSPSSYRINMEYELARITDEFNEIKNYYIDKILDNTK